MDWALCICILLASIRPPAGGRLGGPDGACVDRDLDGALALLDSASLLFDVFADARATLLTSDGALSTALLAGRVRDLESSFASSLDSVEDARRAGLGFSIGLQAPRFREMTALLEKFEARLLLASTVVRDVSSLLANLLILTDGSRSLMDGLIGHGPITEKWSGDALSETLAEVTGLQTR